MHRSLRVALVPFSHAMGFITALLLGAAGVAADGWPVAHGNPANTSYQNVVTAGVERTDHS